MNHWRNEAIYTCATFKDELTFYELVWLHTAHDGSLKIVWKGFFCVWCPYVDYTAHFVSYCVHSSHHWIQSSFLSPDLLSNDYESVTCPKKRFKYLNKRERIVKERLGWVRKKIKCTADHKSWFFRCDKNRFFLLAALSVFLPSRKVSRLLFFPSFWRCFSLFVAAALRQNGG